MQYTSPPRAWARGKQFFENKKSLQKNLFFSENPAQSNASLCARVPTCPRGLYLFAKEPVCWHVSAAPLRCLFLLLHKAFFSHVFGWRILDRIAPNPAFFSILLNCGATNRQFLCFMYCATRIFPHVLSHGILSWKTPSNEIPYT